MAKISMSPDSKTELSGSGTRPPEWEPDTTDVMIGMCTGSHQNTAYVMLDHVHVHAGLHHHQHGTTVL